MYEKVKEQFEHGKRTRGHICKFDSWWIRFNCFYNLEFNKWNDRNNINFIKNDTEIKNIFNNVDSILKENFYNFISGRNWINSLKNWNIQFNVSYICMDCFWEWLEIIYTIRNNQFHWWKDWKNEKYILEKTNKIFELFLKKLYEKYWVI